MISPRADVTAHPRMLTRSSTRPPPLPPVPTPTATLTNPPRALAWYPTASSPRSMPSTSHQYGPRPQNAEPVTGSSSMPVKGKTRRHSNCPYENINKLVFGFRTGQIGWKQIRNTKYEHPPRRIRATAFRAGFSVQPHPQLLVARKGLFRRGDQTQSGDARLVPRHERAPRTTTSHPASAYRLSGGPRREAARPRRDTHGDEVPVAFHLRHSCVRRPRKR